MVSVFVALIEIRPLAGSQLNDKSIGGAAVRCYIPAGDESEARQRLAAMLEADRLELIEIEFCHPYDSPDWEKDDDGTGDAAAKEAISTGQVVFGTFHTWPPGVEGDT